MIDSIFLNGTVGVGNTTARAIGLLEQQAGQSHAVIDLDHLRRAWPAPTSDPFHHQLELRNLRAIAENYRDAGVDHVIVAGVIELESDVPRYRHALGTEEMLICRLEASADVLNARLRSRHAHDPAELSWHLSRADELAAILRVADLDTNFRFHSQYPPGTCPTTEKKSQKDNGELFPSVTSSL